jgi:hypothetical protein
MDRCDLRIDAGIIDYDIQPPELAHCGSHGSFDRGGIAGINPGKGHIVLLRDSLATDDIDVCNENTRALFDKALDSRLAHSGAAAGYEDAFIFQVPQGDFSSARAC